MHIILTEETASRMRDKYIVLELDLVRLDPEKEPVSAFCVIGFDDIVLEDLPNLENLKNLHQKLIENYRSQNWDFCEQALDHLPGKWKGTVDSFYTEIAKRIAKYKENDPGEEWDPAINKY